MDDDPRVAATLGLARALVDGRQSMVELAAGMSLLSAAATWVAEHDLAGEIALPAAPTDADMLAFLEREAHCAVVAAELMAKDPKASAFPEVQRHLASQLARTRREGADLVAGARVRIDDRAALADYLAEVQRGLQAEVDHSTTARPSSALAAAFLLGPVMWGHQVTARDELAVELGALAPR